MQRCPECDKDVNMQPREHSWTEPHGEPCYQEWAHCPNCGADSDWDEVAKATRAEVDRETEGIEAA